MKIVKKKQQPTKQNKKRVVVTVPALWIGT